MSWSISLVLLCVRLLRAKCLIVERAAEMAILSNISKGGGPITWKDIGPDLACAADDYGHTLIILPGSGYVKDIYECQSKCEAMDKCISITHTDKGFCQLTPATCIKTRPHAGVRSFSKAISVSTWSDIGEHRVCVARHFGGRPAGSIEECKKSCEDAIEEYEIDCESISFDTEGHCLYYSTSCRFTTYFPKGIMSATRVRTTQQYVPPGLELRSRFVHTPYGYTCDDRAGKERALRSIAGISYSECEAMCDVDITSCMSITYGDSFNDCTLWATSCTHRRFFGSVRASLKDITLTKKLESSTEYKSRNTWYTPIPYGFVCSQSQGETKIPTVPDWAPSFPECQAVCDENIQCRSITYIEIDISPCTLWSTPCAHRKHSSSSGRSYRKVRPF